MRFAFVSTMHGWPWGGSEELWSQAATQLKQAGHQVQASVVYWPRLSTKVTALEQHGIGLKTHSTNQAGPYRRIWKRLSLSERRGYSQLKRFNPDLVVISQGHNQGGFGWARICREAAIPYVMIVQCNSEFWWFQERNQRSSDELHRHRSPDILASLKAISTLLRLQVGDALHRTGKWRGILTMFRPNLLPIGRKKVEDGGAHVSRASIQQPKGRICYCRYSLVRNGGTVLLN